jgi:polyphosphate glucokinase
MPSEVSAFADDDPLAHLRAAAPPPEGGTGNGPFTLAVDVGGTGLKASVLDALGTPVAERVRIETTYPAPPAKLVADLAGLVRSLPPYDRVSVGFPGVVRGGRVLSAPHFVTAHGPGSEVVASLVEAWTGLDLAAALSEAFGKPTRVVNDADLQGAAVVSGQGLELVLTLGTGFGTALYYDGHLAPHLELSHHPFRKDRTYEDELGDNARRRLGNKKLNRRLREAIATLDRLVFFDRLYVGGGNARHVEGDLGPKAALVDNRAGILGGIRLWERRVL